VSSNEIPGELTYRPVGLTRRDDMAPGFRPLRESVAVGHGREVYERTVNALFRWDVHRGAGLHVVATSERANIGTRVRSTLGLRLQGRMLPLVKAPCEVVWAGTETAPLPDGTLSTGFGYGTLTGHPEQGEEAFIVRMAPDGEVTFHLRAYSRGSTPLLRVLDPVVIPIQERVSQRYLRAAAKLGGISAV
jgi:uncharacterized protein (UPF0548 family)